MSRLADGETRLDESTQDVVGRNAPIKESGARMGRDPRFELIAQRGLNGFSLIQVVHRSVSLALADSINIKSRRSQEIPAVDRTVHRENWNPFVLKLAFDECRRFAEPL